MSNSLSNSSQEQTTPGRLIKTHHAGSSRRKIPQFRYELVNLTAYGGSQDFPISSEVTLWDLRVTHRYASGATEEVAFFDPDGVRRIELDAESVFLRSDEIVPREHDDLIKVTVTGKVKPVAVEIATRGSLTRSRVYPEFVIEAMVAPGLYEAIRVSDSSGRRHAIGTFGIVAEASQRFEDLTSARSRRFARRDLTQNRTRRSTHDIRRYA